MKYLGVLVLLSALVLFSPVARVFADEVEDLEKDLEETREQIRASEQELARLQEELENAQAAQGHYQGALDSYSYELYLTRLDLGEVELSLAQKEEEVSYTESLIKEAELEARYKEALLRQAVRESYIETSRSKLSRIVFVRHAYVSHLSAYMGAVRDSYKSLLDSIVATLHTLDERKGELALQKEELAVAQDALAMQKDALAAQVVQTQQQIQTIQLVQQDLSQTLAGVTTELASLTQKEREILEAKAAAALASNTVGNEATTWTAIDADPPVGGLYFSFWTYGYPHQVGMSQYGALGRSRDGQTAEQILMAYFAEVSVGIPDEITDTITVSTSSGDITLGLEEYLYGLGEMPSCWGTADYGGFEALKAQVIASRSYALNYTNNGASPICSDQGCQVYVGESKIAGACGEIWKQAVDETKGLAVLHGGAPIPAWYSISAGGFTRSSLDAWGGARPFAQAVVDVDSVGRAYDGPDLGESPWYHKAWGNEPWLSGTQVADLVNATLLPEAYADHLPSESNGGFSAEQVRDALVSEGIQPFANVTEISVVGANESATKTLHVSGDSGNVVDVSAQDFRFVYNVRSPGTNAIWTQRFDVIANNQ